MVDNKNPLISLLPIPILAIGADKSSHDFLNTLAKAEKAEVEIQFGLGFIYLECMKSKRKMFSIEIFPIITRSTTSVGEYYL